MKTTFFPHHPFLLLLPFLLLFAACGSDTEQASSGGSEIWTCPMHPSVQSDRPGACPVCHMDLVKKAESQELSDAEDAMLRSVTLSPAQRLLANVETQAATRRRMSQTVRAPGVVDFAEPLQAVVSARFRGRIEKLHVAETGTEVRRGQPLFDLYSPELVSTQQDFLVALDAYDRAEASGAASTMELQTRLIDVMRERLTLHYGLAPQRVAELERSRRAQAVVSIPAPIGGTVIRKAAQEGRYVEDGAVVYELADLSRVWVFLEIPERQIRFIKTGQSAELRADAWPGEVFVGVVRFIDPVMQPQTRSTRVRVEVPNTGKRLKPQMFVTGTILIDGGPVLAVPATAVLRTGRRDVLWVETADNTFEPRVVTLGTKEDGFVEITEGLEEGELVAVSGGYLLDSESTLTHGDLPTTHGTHDGSADGAGASPPEGASMQSHEPAGGGTAAQLRVLVKAGYHPDTLRARRGQPIRISFERREDIRCSDEIVFPALGINRTLPPFRATVIDIPPRKAGSYRFQCGMDMLHGVLIVE